MAVLPLFVEAAAAVAAALVVSSTALDMISLLSFVYTMILILSMVDEIGDQTTKWK